MTEMPPEDWLATHKSEGPTNVHTLENAVQRAYDGTAEAIKLLAAGSYIPAQGPLRDALNWLKIADEADAWIKMTESRRAPGLGTDPREPSLSPALMFDKAVAARALEPGQVVVLDGRVVEVGPAPETDGRVRIVIVTALGVPPGDRPDPRELVVTCEGAQSFCTARRFGPDDPLRGPGLTLGDYGLALEDIVGVDGLDAGRVIVFDGEVVSREPDATGSVRLLLHVGPSRRELIVVCPGDMELGAAKRGEPRGLRFDKPVDAGRLEVGQVLVVDGRVLESGPDPQDATRVRLVLVTVLGPPPGDEPDQRELVLSCPRNMKLGTAIPHNLDPPATSA